MVSEKVKLERAKRKTLKAEKQEERFDLLLTRFLNSGGSEIVFSASALLGIQKLSEWRMINRDIGGICFILGVVMAASRVGVKDTLALGAIGSLAAVTFSLTTPSKEGDVGSVDFDWGSQLDFLRNIPGLSVIGGGGLIPDFIPWLGKY